MTNVVPLLSKVDGLDYEDLAVCKDRTLAVFRSEGIECFSFDGPGHTEDQSPSIYAVSNAPSTDYDIIDASTLMSSQYVPPLVTTDLEALVGRLFSPDGAARLRHSAAAKCVNLRHENRGNGTVPPVVVRHRDLRYGVLAPVITTNLFSVHHHWVRIDLSNWAQCLRQSLDAERLRTMGSHRMALDLCAQGRRSAALSRCRKGRATPATLSNGYAASLPHRQDPLGLLALSSQLKTEGRIIVELLASIGILGSLAAVLLRPDWLYQGSSTRSPRWLFILP